AGSKGCAAPECPGRYRPLTARRFGKFLAKWFLEGHPGKDKNERSRVFTGDLMVGLGGLEPPTSPLSGARSSHLSYRPACRVANNCSTLSYQPIPGNSLALPKFPFFARSPLEAIL